MKKDTVIQILREFRKENEERFHLKSLGIFGSVARGEAKEGSDVDVFIETDVPDMFIFAAIKDSLEKKLKVDVDIVRMRKKMNSFLKKRIERDAIYV